MFVFGIPLSFFLPLIVHVWAGLATVIIGIVVFRVVLQEITSSGRIEPKDETEMMKATRTVFKWRYFEAEIILLCLRWYLRYALNYRDLEEIMAERGHAAGPYDHLSVGTAVRA